MSNKAVYNFVVLYESIKKQFISKDFACLVLIILLSVYPRVLSLAEKPPINVDEAANLRDIFSIIKADIFNPPDFHWDFSKTQLLYYPVIKFINIWGLDKGLLALRSTSVFLSIFGLVPFYFIAKDITNRLIASCITLLFSTSYYYLQFSRVGWINIIFVVSIGLYLFWTISKAVKIQSFTLIVLSGAIAGILFYTYRSNIIYISTSATLLVVSLWNKRLSKRKIFTWVFVYFFIFLITALPWLIKIAKHPDKYNLRAKVVHIKNVNKPYHGLYTTSEIIKYQISTSIKSWILLQGINGGGSENSRYLPQTTSPVNILVRLCFIFGLIIGLSIYKKVYWWYIIYILGIIFGQILTVNPPNGARGVIMLPFIYLFASLALHKTYLKWGKKWFFAPFLITLSIIFSLADFLYYQNWMTWIKV